MANLTVVLYTSVGGIIGAIVTHYFTQIRDRRAARALVLENAIKVEAAYAALKPEFSETSIEFNFSLINEALGSFEASALIAGVPRSILQIYISTVRLNCAYKRLGATADDLTLRALKATPKLLKSRSHEPAVILDSLREVLGFATKLHEMANDEKGEDMRRSALSFLSTSLWHPLGIRIVRKKISGLKNYADKLDDRCRQLASVSKRIENTTDLPSFVLRLLSILEDGSYDPSLINF